MRRHALLSQPRWCSGKIDLTEVGGERYFFCNEQNEKGEPVHLAGAAVSGIPHSGDGI
ncbi:hypothetical protein MS6204_03472 [Escherichia coli]|nr:hypothetical protein [Escherichia coli]